MTGPPCGPDLPATVRVALCPDPDAVIVDLREEPLPRGTGAATGQAVVLRGRLRTQDGESLVSVVRKSLRPLTESRHAAFAGRPRHWAYWRREIEAYQSDLLPGGPGLRAPRCLGIVGNDVFLELVAGAHPSVERAAQHLARWQTEYVDSRDRPWLAIDQLGARLAATELDWTSIEADKRVERLWDRRYELYERLRALPPILSHGDYSIGNLVADGADTVAMDWATVGWERPGFDLAHLALSTGEDPIGAYLAAAPPSLARADIAFGFGAAAAIIGASRVHWMLSRGIDIPPWYVDLLHDRLPR